MHLVKGSKKIELSIDKVLLSKYTKIHLDLGTGDGRFVYKKAKDYPHEAWFGADPSEQQLRIFSSKINKDRLENAFLLITNAEDLPSDFKNFFDQISINYPWGSLLKLVVSPTTEYFSNINNVLKTGGLLTILFGYHSELEPSESERLKLPEVNEEFINTTLVPLYRENNLELLRFEKLSKENMKNYETSWSKKLGHSFSERPVYLVEFKKC